jgi:hypothetical protein
MDASCFAKPRPRRRHQATGARAVPGSTQYAPRDLSPTAKARLLESPGLVSFLEGVRNRQAAGFQLYAFAEAAFGLFAQEPCS